MDHRAAAAACGHLAWAAERFSRHLHKGMNRRSHTLHTAWSGHASEKTRGEISPTPAHLGRRGNAALLLDQLLDSARRLGSTAEHTA